MAYWTTSELRRLKEAHKGKRPHIDELWAMFPNRSRHSVESMTGRLGLRHPVKWRPRATKR